MLGAREADDNDGQDFFNRTGDENLGGENPDNAGAEENQNLRHNLNKLNEVNEMENNQGLFN